MTDQGQLSKQVASGVAWNILEKIGSTLLQIVVSIVVVNRIMPDDLGVIAVLTVFCALSQVVIDSGFSQTLIRKAKPTTSDFNTVFIFDIVTSLGLYLLLVTTAPLLANYYNWDLLYKVAPILYLVLPLNGLCVIQNSIMVKEFKFATLSTIIFLSSLISGVIAIAMAFSGFGIWSLVGQRVSMMAVKAILLWIKSPWRPSRDIDNNSFKEMAPYSLRLIITDFITALYNNVAQLFIGKIYSADQLGYFNQAQKLKDMPVNATMLSIQNVTFSALSKISDNDTKFTEGYRRIIMLTSFIMFPIMAGLISTAEDIYMLVLKPQWHPSIPYFRILCLIGICYPIAAVAYNVLKARSDGGIILRLEIIKKMLMTIILLITIPINVKAIAWGMVIASACEMALNIAASLRYTTLSVSKLLRTLAPIVALTLIMIISTEFIGYLSANYAVVLRLLLKIATGVATYILGGYILRMEAFKEAIVITRQLIEKVAGRS